MPVVTLVPMAMSHQHFYYSFTQEVPSRFKKEIVRAAAPQGQSDVCLNGMKRVLTNIGAQDRLTAEEIQSIFAEHANETGNIPGEKLIRQVL